MYERFLPLKHHLEKMLGTRVVLRVARDDESARPEIGRGDVHIAFLDPAGVLRGAGEVPREGQALASAVESGSGVVRVVDAGGKRLALGMRESAFSYVTAIRQGQYGVDRARGRPRDGRASALAIIDPGLLARIDPGAIISTRG